jgi:hypothetical protein
MISTALFHTDDLIWLLVAAGSVIGALTHWTRSGQTEAAVLEPSQPAPIAPSPLEPNPLPVPTQRVGIPPTALVRIHEACSGMIKDGELDIRFELRSRRDCDKMLEVMGRMKENLQHTKSVINHAEAEIRAQLGGPAAAAGTKTSRLSGMFGRDAAGGEQFATAKLAELQGYETATRLIDKYILELGGAEMSVLDLPFYTNPDPATAPEHRPGVTPQSKVG